MWGLTVYSKITEKVSLGYSILRSANYALQGVLLPWVDVLATGRRRDVPRDYVQHLWQALPKIRALLERDAKNISEGLYPVEVLRPEGPLEHGLRLPFVYLDAFRSAQRRNKKETKVFDASADELLEDVPEYYRRNFHFQSNGYLGKSSADLYEHQVEILFSGAADAMRRLLIPSLKKHFAHAGDGTGLHFLEIGSGTGRLTRFIALAFPKAHITCVDLSSFYLKEAQVRLGSFHRIDYMQGKGEALPLVDGTFDAVFSCFLFHELPSDVRVAMVQEGRRLLKPNGLYGMVDSLQWDDDSEFNWALEQFAKDFHEPFYKDYTQKPLETLLKEAGLTDVQAEIGFLSKAVTGVIS